MNCKPSDPIGDYQRARQVLDGASVPEDAAALAKMLKLVLGERGTDAEISAAGFFVRFPYHAKGTLYLSHLAAPTLQRLMRFGGISHCVRGAAFRVDPSSLGEGPRWVWLRADEDAVRVSVRAATAEGPPPELPDGLPPPLPPPSRRVAIFPEPFGCPHCKVGSVTWRYVGSILICKACGRSSEPDAELLNGARVVDEAV